MAAIYNFRNYKSGTTFDGVEFTINVNGTVLDISGVVIEFKFGNKTPLSTSNGKVTITDAANGVFEIPEQILPYSAGTYNYICIFKFSNGEEKEYLKGRLIVT